MPNLLRRPDQVETANQLALVMTYGVAVITAAGLFTADLQRQVLVLPGDTAEISTAYVALVINGVALPAHARSPSGSGSRRSPGGRAAAPGRRARRLRRPAARRRHVRRAARRWSAGW